MNGRRNHWFVAGAAVAVLALAPLVLGNFAVSLLNDIGIASLVALGLVLLTGVGGATSFGQAAFVGIAAYATAWLTKTQGVSPWLGLLFALLLTGAAALAIGMLTLRLGGHFLPLSTIAWGLSIALLFGKSSMFIYLTHVIVLSAVERLHLTSEALVLAATLLGSVVAAAVLNRAFQFAAGWRSGSISKPGRASAAG